MNKKKEKTIEDLRAYYPAFEQSSEYLKILHEVMKEVYSPYVKKTFVQIR